MASENRTGTCQSTNTAPGDALRTVAAGAATGAAVDAALCTLGILCSGGTFAVIGLVAGAAAAIAAANKK
jgi:hypothetical protein